MKPDLICEWLGLPAGTWPPDHYRLLGLEPGESDAERIEQRVHERLEAVRHYQMAHPEQATEAMNRLAQAYVCLTDAVQQAGLRRGPAGHGRPGGRGRGAGRQSGAARPAGVAVRPGRRPALVVGHAAAVAASAPPAARPTRAASVGRDGGSGRAGRCRRRRRPAVAEGAPRPGHQAGLVSPRRRHAQTAARLGAAGQVRRTGEAAAEPHGGRPRAGAAFPGNAIAFAYVPASPWRGGAARLPGGHGGAPGRFRAQLPGAGPWPARGPEPRLGGRPKADRRAPRLPPSGGPRHAPAHLDTAAGARLTPSSRTSRPRFSSCCCWY